MSQNIQIAVRVRPQNKRENGQSCLVKMKNNTITIKPPSNLFKNQDIQNMRMTFTQQQSEEKVFSFKHCYWSYDGESQKMVKNIDMYKDIGEQLISNVFDGYNSTIFAYGQTGSGKSYTIEGQQEELGLLQHCLSEVFKRKQDNQKQGVETKIFVSYLEIYNEELRDLLDPSKKNLKIYSTSEGVLVQNLSRVFCENLDEVMNLLKEGKKIRVVGSHAMNQKSSRSHAIFMVKIIQKEGTLVKMAKLNIVDLAGSERYSKTQSDSNRLQEASNINKSLTFLGLVIESLATNQTKGQNLHVPYRNSQLTHLLSESLCGNSKTFMIANISGAEENYDETLSTLRFAERVQCIKTNSIQNITDQDANQNKALEKQIELMKKKIADLTNQASQSKNKFLQDDKEYDNMCDLKEALEQELKNNENLLDDAQNMIQQERQRKQNLQNQRNQLLKEAGVQLPSDSSNQQQLKDIPYLMNISDDPSLSGCLLYYLKQGQNQFGNQKTCDVIINGLGIRRYFFKNRQHCIIKNENHSKLSIQIFSDARIMLNGALLEHKPKNVYSLNHLDRLHIGHDLAFKVIIPKLNKTSQKENSQTEDFMKGRLGQSTESSKQLKKIMDEMRTKLSQSQFTRFLDQVAQALDNIDKANEITLFRYRKFPLRSHNIYFNLELLTSILQTSSYNIEFGVSLKNRDTDQLLCIWTYYRFQSRLDDMLLWYSHEHRVNNNTQEELNPWVFTSYQKDFNKMTTKQLYRHYYAEVKNMQEKIQKLSQDQQTLLSQIIKLGNLNNINIQQEDIELYADIFFRAVEKIEATKIVNSIQNIPKINFFVKQYMEISAEMTFCQMQKYESQQQLDKIIITHKRQSQKNSCQESESSNIQSQNQTQNTFYSLQIQNGQQKVLNQNDQLQQQYIFQQRLIPQQQQFIYELKQKNTKLKKQLELLMK